MAAATGCHRTFSGSVAQPNPLVHPNETLRDSEAITIVTGDMELVAPEDTGGSLLVNKRVPLRNRASFTVVSRDRLRFHVQLEHKWSEWASLGGWSAYLIDDRGRRFVPESIDRIDDVHVVRMWDYETRSARRDAYGNLVAIANDGHKRRKPLGSLSVFRGTGDVVFYHRDIFTPAVRSLTLVLTRRGQSFSWTWRFTDSAAGGAAPARHLAGR